MHSLLLADLGDPVSQFWIGVGSLILSAVAIVITVLLALRGRQRKRLTYEVVSNTSVINVNNDVGEDLELLLGGQIVNNVRLYVIKVVNAGNIPIDEQDYRSFPSFRFQSEYARPVVRAAIHLTGSETFLLPRPADQQQQLKDMIEIDETPGQTVILKPPLLNPRQAVHVRVLLEANGPKSTSIKVSGQIVGGDDIKEYSPPPTRLTLRFVVTGVLIAFVLGLLISNSIGLLTAFARGSCSFGTIQASGSTSFYRTALLEAQHYNAICPSQIAHISINESSSGAGMTALENGSVQIANSELSTPYANLVDHPVAAIVFALVLNKQVTGISDLSTAQIQQIYNGTVKTWDQLGSPQHLPIRIIGRATDSGTHAAFVKYVLQGSEASLPPSAVIVSSSGEVVNTVANTPGAIGYADLGDTDPARVTTLTINQSEPTSIAIERGAYPFWAIEHMYTLGNPDTLTTSFIRYVIQDLQTNDTFIRLNTIDASVLAQHT
jgi:phosphate transport system substrate-binding protein